MDDKTIEKIVLNFFYTLSKPIHSHNPIILFSENKEFSKDKILKVFYRLLDQQLINKHPRHQHLYEITARGILYSEENDFFMKGEMEFHKLVRYKILTILAGHYEVEGNFANLSGSVMSEKLKIDASIINANIDVLKKCDFVKPIHHKTSTITELGLRQAKDWQQRYYFKDEFNRISKLTPQPRGIALQKLLAEIIKFAGCNADEGVRRSHEEIDVVFEYNGNFFLVECKWEKKKTEAPVVRELKGKLDNRSEIKGVLASIAGFTSGAEVQVFEYINQKIILLFGKEDILQIINNPDSFKSLVDDKYKKLIVKKEVLWK